MRKLQISYLTLLVFFFPSLSNAFIHTSKPIFNHYRDNKVLDHRSLFQAVDKSIDEFSTDSDDGVTKEYSSTTSHTYKHRDWTLAYQYKASSSQHDDTSSPVLCLIHPVGIGLSSWFWKKLMEEWEGAVYAVNLIGCGLEYGAGNIINICISHLCCIFHYSLMGFNIQFIHSHLPKLILE